MLLARPALASSITPALPSRCASAGIEIEFIAKAHIRKEEVVARALEARGDRPGLVHVLSAMEACTSYRRWHDKASGKTSLKPDSGKCLHYYFYFIDPVLGLLYLRVPTCVSVRAPVLPQRPRVAGAQAAEGGHRLHPGRGQTLTGNRRTQQPIAILSST
ncbi:MAG: hypothetical protein ACREYF_11165 [Gammaproteobacteria bacterium]